MVAELAAMAAIILSSTAEALHLRRVRCVAGLAFGPTQRPRRWAQLAPWLRVIALGALVWGLVTLIYVRPKVYEGEKLKPGSEQHIVIVYDVSPSMRLEDAGPTAKQARRERARDVLQSLFERIPADRYRTTVVAVYNGAKPVVIDTRDLDVVDGILSDLPLHQAFDAGKTQLLSGLDEAARIAKPWNPRSTAVILVSDGDTVPPQGMPAMPNSVHATVVLGVGDTVKGKFIDGHQSRQDVSTLNQIAIRLRGSYHNVNTKHLTSAFIQQVVASGQSTRREPLTRREYALMAAGIGSATLALLPLLLHYGGTSWHPGRVAETVVGQVGASIGWTKTYPSTSLRSHILAGPDGVKHVT